MAWCEAEGVAYLFGLASPTVLRLKAVLKRPRPGRQRGCAEPPARRLGCSGISPTTTETSWSRPRRVVKAEAEHLPGTVPIRVSRMVTSLGREKIDARGHLRRSLLRPFGEMAVDRIKECQLDLFADRTSSATMQANQLRLWFASMAYVLLSELHRIALRHTQFADAHLRHHPAEAVEDRCPGPS